MIDSVRHRKQKASIELSCRLAQRQCAQTDGCFFFLQTITSHSTSTRIYRMRFQYTRPAWGRDPADKAPSSNSAHFNPRAPRGARQSLKAAYIQRVEISIHAPAWGATRRRSKTRQTSSDFNPHARVGRDIYSSMPPTSQPTFQSTRPVWGATSSRRHRRHGRGISIHAPRVGRDLECLRLFSKLPYFNPRAPCGARHT